MNFLPYCTAFHYAKSRLIVVFTLNVHAVFRMPPRRRAMARTPHPAVGLESLSICSDVDPFGSPLRLPGSGVAVMAGSNQTVHMVAVMAGSNSAAPSSFLSVREHVNSLGLGFRV